MNRKISTYEELLEEKLRLQELLQTQKEVVKNDFIVLRDEIKPVTAGIISVATMFSKAGHRPKTSPLLNFGLDIGTEIFLKRYLLGHSGWLIRMVVPFIVRNYSAKILSERNKPFWDKIKRVFKKND